MKAINNDSCIFSVVRIPREALLSKQLERSEQRVAELESEVEKLCAALEAAKANEGAKMGSGQSLIFLV
jgi:uncharacterized protein YlxW (UPF0749 family)